MIQSMYLYLEYDFQNEFAYWWNAMIFQCLLEFDEKNKKIKKDASYGC